MKTGTELTLVDYRYPGVRALVLLQEQELRDFVDIWKDAKDAGVVLSGFKSPNYESLDTLLVHVLWWARDYMVWTCEMLGLPGPEINEVPDVCAVEANVESYVDHLLERWRLPLSDTPEEPFFDTVYTTRWSIDYPVEALLEHAVVHPMRHRLQVLELMSSMTT
jgi:hypothetical protein